MTRGDPTAHVQEAVGFELALAGGFPVSIGELVGELSPDPVDDPVDSRHGRVLGPRVAAALLRLEDRGAVHRVRWHGVPPDRTIYWVLSTSPWATRPGPQPF